MLAGLLLPVAIDIQNRGGKLHELSEEELHKIHNRYKGLIKWITKKSKVSEVFSQQLIDKIEKEDIVALRNLLFIEDEEAMILILIAANLT